MPWLEIMPCKLLKWVKAASPIAFIFFRKESLVYTKLFFFAPDLPDLLHAKIHYHTNGTL